MRKLRSIIFMACMAISLPACSMGRPLGKSTPERKLQDKMFRPCQDFEVKDPVGKFCNKRCKKLVGRKCKKWHTVIKDFKDPKVFEFFRAGSFILIDEDQVL